MTAPYLPPIKSVEGITLREALTYERTVDDGEEVPPPGLLRVEGMGALSIYDEAGALRLVRQPTAQTLYHAFNWKRYDATPYTHARLCGHRKVAGASGATLRVLYTTDPTDLSTAVTAGDTVPVDLALDGLGPATTVGLVPLVAGARADVYWGVVALGGDGVLSPEMNAVEIEFYSAAPVRTERWYWRTGSPSITPDYDAPNLIGNPEFFWNCSPPPDLEPWLSVSPGAPAATPQRLLRAKGNDEAGLSTTTENGHHNVSGGVGRFVGPPLAAQTIPAFVSTVGFAGIAYSGSVAGHATARLSLYRPGVGVVASSTIPNYGALWYRYVTRAHVAAMSMSAVEAQAGDRFVLDVTADVEIACAGGFVTEGLGVTIYYNGSNDTFADFEEVGNIAAYVDLPRLQYLSDTP